MSDLPAVWPCLYCTNPRAMIEFLTRAFGFVVRMEHAEGDVVHHAELTWHLSAGRTGGVMLGPARPGSERHTGNAAIHVVTDDPDAVHATAMTAGATEVRPLADVDYGSRIFEVTDPEGNLWSFGTWHG